MRKKTNVKAEVIDQVLNTDKTYKQIAKELGRSPQYISNVARACGIRKRPDYHIWTTDEEKRLMELHTYNYSDISHLIETEFKGMSKCAISHKLEDLRRRYGRNKGF